MSLNGRTPSRCKWAALEANDFFDNAFDELVDGGFVAVVVVAEDGETEYLFVLVGEVADEVSDARGDAAFDAQGA